MINRRKQSLAQWGQRMTFKDGNGTVNLGYPANGG